VASFDLIRHHRHNDRAFLYAFDLIELNGDDMRRDSPEVRKATRRPGDTRGRDGHVRQELAWREPSKIDDADRGPLSP
jgi:hypothetical protein